VTRRRVAVGAAVALAAMSRVAVADPPTNVHIVTASKLHSTGGADLQLPPGYFLDERTYTHLDDELRRLQVQEARLTAENGSLAKTVSSWQPGWVTVALAVATGATIGWYVKSQF
jgi:hypothetical protein